MAAKAIIIHDDFKPGSFFCEKAPLKAMRQNFFAMFPPAWYTFCGTGADFKQVAFLWEPG